MSPSSDIETLFGHFGGNAGDYQEIGRENEAGTARTRWPLLVTLDLKQTPIPAIAQRHERLAQQGGDAEAQHGEPDAAAHPVSSANAASAATPTMRSKAPLFARPHRRNVPPVANVVKADAPRGGDRFGAVPEVSTTVNAVHEAGATTEPVVSVAAMPVASAATVPPVFSRPAATAPASTRTFASSAVPAAASRPAVPPVAPAWANPLAVNAPPAARSATLPAAPVARTSAATQPPSILGRLFATAAPQPAQAIHARPGDTRPAELNSVFDRLRGAPSSPAAPVPAPHSWLNNGPRRS